jgi:hypothetical protein
MMKAVGHLETHGLVLILKNSSGEEYILLVPELLADLAASCVLLADRHPRHLGAISEAELLQGRYPFAELEGLEQAERHILLDAALLRFVEHTVCFRETLGSDTLLIFPRLIKLKRPGVEEFDSTDDVSYVARGKVENLYPALVVLLGQTPTFTRIHAWQRQAQYEMGKGQICGFRMIEEVEGEIELVLYYSATMPEYGRDMFKGLFEQFLYERDVQVTRFPPITCPRNHPQERTIVVNRIREGKRFLFCAECGARVSLPELEKPVIDLQDAPWIRREKALARLRSTYEAHLVRVKAFRRDRAAPRCYISHLPEDSAWVRQLAHDLQDAGVYLLQGREQVESVDFVITVDSRRYQESFARRAESIAADAELVTARWEVDENSNVISLSGIEVGFLQRTRYPVVLFDLVLCLYSIPLNDRVFSPFRESLHREWEEMPQAEEEGATDLLWGLKRELIDELFKLPVTSTAGGRTSLLDGIPGADALSRDMNNARVDLDRIITQMARLGRMVNGELPLVRLIDNALPHARGFEGEETLEEFQNQLRSAHGF